uniref:Neurochondrin n=2 Tax=Caenorhabditis tropicalis TaxID=1561998 RepID=A0A1I7TG69_9PELO
MVYCTENVHDTFMCTFNVLTIGDDDCMMTRQIAADLLRRLVVSESSTGVPTLASTGKNVLNYGFFIGSIQQTARLLVSLDPRTEESSKIYDLLLAFCSLQQLRGPVCQAIIRCQPTETQLTTPLVAIAATATLSPLKFGESTENATLKALKLLAHLLKECIEPQEKMPDVGIPTGQLIDLIATCLDEHVEVGEEQSDRIQKVQLGLRLAEVLAHDEQCRNRILLVCTAHLCQQIATWQFSKNPVVGYLTKPPKERSEKLDAQWTVFGIGIILELCRLLAVLKDHSKVHKDQYWQLLKDERIIPFLAYGISYGDQETVQQAFLTYSHCAQVPAFPSHLLSEMVASCKAVYSTPATSSSNLNSQKESPESRSRQDSENRVGSGDVFFSDERSSQKALDDLLRKVTLEGVPLKDAKTTELFAAYERKIQMLQLREKELEVQLKAASKPTSSQINHEVENSTRFRELSQECESLRSQKDQLTDILTRGNLEREQLKTELNEIKQKSETIEQSLGLCITEKGALKSQLNEMILNADRAAQASQVEISKLNADLAQNVTRIEVFLNENKKLKLEFEEKVVECEVLKEHIHQIDAELKTKIMEVERAHSQTAAAEQKTSVKEIELAEAEKHLKLYEARLTDRERDLKLTQLEVDRLKTELDQARRNLQKLEHMREAMLSLASGGSN